MIEVIAAFDGAPSQFEGGTKRAALGREVETVC
jgi:hypothetical protein